MEMNEMKKTLNRLLYVVDDQFDFVMKDGKLPVPDAEDIIEPTNAFFKALKPTDFDEAIFTYDTHFIDEYTRSPEAELFPLHCEYGTKGWELVVDDLEVSRKIKTYYMTKNTFDAFGDNPLRADANIAFAGGLEKKVYNNLRIVTTDRKCVDAGLARDAYFERVNEQTEVCVTGVASDYCVHDAMLGLLKRGASVVVLSDLVKGIGTPVEGRAPSGKIEDVLKLDVFKPFVEAGKLNVMTSKEYLAKLDNEQKQKPKPKRRRASGWAFKF